MIQRTIAIAIAPSVPGLIGSQAARSPMTPPRPSSGSMTTYFSPPGSARASAVTLAMSCIGKLASPGCVPQKMMNSACVMSGIDLRRRDVMADFARIGVFVGVDAAEGLAETDREALPAADDAPALEHVAVGPVAQLGSIRIHEFGALGIKALEA